MVEGGVDDGVAAGTQQTSTVDEALHEALAVLHECADLLVACRGCAIHRDAQVDRVALGTLLTPAHNHGRRLRGGKRETIPPKISHRGDRVAETSPPIFKKYMKNEPQVRSHYSLRRQSQKKMSRVCDRDVFNNFLTGPPQNQDQVVAHVHNTSQPSTRRLRRREMKNGLKNVAGQYVG